MAERNNFARLSYDMRRRIMHLMINGASQAEIRADQDVAAELARRGLQLHSTTFLAIRRCPEYAEYKKSLEGTSKKVAADRWAAEALRDCAGITSVADLTQMRLLESLRELAESGSGEPADLLKIATAVTKIRATDLDARVDRLENALAAAKDECNRLRAERASDVTRWNAVVAEKDAVIAELRKRCGDAGGNAVIEEMDRYVRGE